MTGALQRDESELITDLTSTHTGFLDSVRYGDDDDVAWDEFYTILLQQITDFGFAELPWIPLVLARWLPSLREEIKRDVLAGYEDGPLFVLFIRRVREFIIAIQRWARWHNAQSESDYHYIITAYLAIYLMYRKTWLPVWAHQKLYYLLIHFRHKLASLGDEVVISKIFLELASSMKSFMKEVRKGKCTRRKWRKHMNVFIGLVNLSYEVEEEMVIEKLTTKKTRDKLTEIVNGEKDDGKVYDKVVRCIAEILGIQ